MYLYEEKYDNLKGAERDNLGRSLAPNMRLKRTYVLEAYFLGSVSSVKI